MSAVGKARIVRGRAAAGAAAAVLGLGAVGLGAVVAAPAGAEPMCVEFFADTFDSTLANHGQHIVGDYVAGMGHDASWPPAGQVGELVGGRGPVKPGAPGIQSHGASPGASFCNGSSSPTSPPGHG